MRPRRCVHAPVARTCGCRSAAPDLLLALVLVLVLGAGKKTVARRGQRELPCRCPSPPPMAALLDSGGGPQPASLLSSTHAGRPSHAVKLAVK
ncbi:hypothetical protein PAHAL_9G561900 [Panicum hallii]|uniref:Uncharacterized protein n=1 Tax=Panicum hallii TaxID=206008 RepID=A0A2S3ITX9_9POAL|nr:hypothetical protein PAHAL_9G561900 [Panicum hallii]